MEERRGQAARRPAAGQPAHGEVVVGHERCWLTPKKNPNPNREETLEERKAREKTAGKNSKGRGRVKAVGVWELDEDKIIFPKSYEVADSVINEKNRQLVGLMNDIREVRNTFIKTALGKKTKDWNKVLHAHKKSFNSLRSKVPPILEDIDERNGRAVPYPKHLKALPDHNDLPDSNKSA